MSISFSAFGCKTGLIKPGDDLIGRILASVGEAGEIRDGDIIVIAESALATAEGRVIRLSDVTPSDDALRYGERYAMDPRVAEVVISESDEVIGGIPGFLLCLKDGTLLPNAGVDGSNAPEGTIIPLPHDPNASAYRIRNEIFERTNRKVAVLVIDSRTHAMRLGVSGVTIGCSGMAVIGDCRGTKDLFGRKLMVTRRAVGDCIASAAELLMGEADEAIPVVIVRGLDNLVGEGEGIETIAPDECLFMGAVRKMERKN
ncbi:MAG: F420-dependent oxidoreductase [Methanomicrobiales archaeon 53_19]|jgi:coenzyme F420-0:L-glutamate ligase|uniref:coenzyme F420-0:L-glutamate ligase n=1 Tax=Methanocalculus sp. TaxID=2004547 RepID=UPI000748850B|nr:coenzyme F420-0:L-glutamate ligase [Methanocalculus sp.]KUK69796.1 MAG: F420-dependent oxidoreductase [Methanocalculus sp. 52_23]KUL03021.1 MAG: F420-dependent oxidoreductase [Methanomicrobiales archaeon 53_19]HIJ06202.1 coenzyme F420-0:L-glutamate ligase [Methanocalculus sp.]